MIVLRERNLAASDFTANAICVNSASTSTQKTGLVYFKAVVVRSVDLMYEDLVLVIRELSVLF